MNKKHLVFVMISFFALALVSAALVNYLSNTSVATVNIDSPFEVSFWNGEEFVENFNPTMIYGGETLSLTGKVTKLTSVEAEVDIEIVVTNDEGNPRCDDFTNLFIKGETNDGTERNYYNGTLNGIGCTENHGPETVTITIPAYYTADEEWENYYSEWTTDLAIQPATYDFAVTVRPRTPVPV